MNNQKLGSRGEALAADYLEGLGYRLMDRNYRFKHAEIDLICFEPTERYEDGGEIVFVEVKTRTSTDFGNPEAAVNVEKQKNLIRAARYFLHERRLDGAACRFDVVAIRIRDGEPEIQHLKGAFQT